MMVCVAVWQGMKGFRERFEGEGLEVFAYTDDISLGFMGVTANTVRATSFVRRKHGGLDIVASPAKTALLPPKRHASTGGGFTYYKVSTSASLSKEG